MSSNNGLFEDCVDLKNEIFKNVESIYSLNNTLFGLKIFIGSSRSSKFYFILQILFEEPKQFSLFQFSLNKEKN